MYACCNMYVRVYVCMCVMSVCAYVCMCVMYVSCMRVSTILRVCVHVSVYVPFAHMNVCRGRMCACTCACIRLCMDGMCVCNVRWLNACV